MYEITPAFIGIVTKIRGHVARRHNIYLITEMTQRDDSRSLKS